MFTNWIYFVNMWIPHFPFLQVSSPTQTAAIPQMQVVPEQVFPLVQEGLHAGDSKILDTIALRKSNLNSEILQQK